MSFDPDPAQKRAPTVQRTGDAASPPAPSGGRDGGVGVQEPRGGTAPPSREELERVRRREPEALAAFFERYFDQVYGIVHRLLGERAVAEDVTQDVFLKVHRAAHQLDPGRDPGPWLTAIACNACRDLWRSGAWRMGRRSASVDDDPTVAARLVSASPDPERGHLAAERERLVREALATLPEPLRVAIVLHDYEGLSHQQVAEITGIEHAAARKRYSRAIAALGARLKETLGA